MRLFHVIVSISAALYGPLHNPCGNLAVVVDRNLACHVDDQIVVWAWTNDLRLASIRKLACASNDHTLMSHADDFILFATHIAHTLDTFCVCVETP